MMPANRLQYNSERHVMVEPMTDADLVAYLQDNATRALGHYETQIANAQAQVINYYEGRLDDLNVEPDRSTVVDRTVSIVVDNFVANMLKPFVSADETVRFEPHGQEDVAAADQATEYVNYILHCDNPGFMILHDWVKDAGMARLGIVKAWWERKAAGRPRRIEALDAGQVEQLGDSIVAGPWFDPETGLFGADVRDEEDGRVRIENVPPEEYLISPYARPGAVPPYEAHRTRKARSELIEMGFDPAVVETLPKYQGQFDDERVLARYRDEQYDNYRTDAPGDASRDLIEIHHEFILIDFDGDGVSELRECIRATDVLLYNEEVEFGPFARFCPIPMPHKIYGGCPGEQVIDDQKVKTVLLRQQLDNLYLANNPRPVLPEGAERSDGSTHDSLADRAPGAAIFEGRQPIRFEAVPFVADKVYAMQDYMDREIERKTGIAKQGQSLDRETLNIGNQMTATQAMLEEEGQNARLEMMARIFAETGLSDLFRIILKLIVKYQPRERVVRLRNTWVPMDPRSWHADMDLSVSVGLGVGNQQAQQAQAQGVLALMERIGQTPFAGLINEGNVFAALKRAFTALGIKNVDDYLAPPREGAPEAAGPGAGPDSVMLKMQAEAQIRTARLQADQVAATARLEMQQREAAAKIEMEREKAALQLELERDKAAAQIQLDRERMAAEMELARENAIRDFQLAMPATDAQLSENRPGGDLDK